MKHKVWQREYFRESIHELFYSRLSRSSISSTGRLDHSTWQILRDLGLNKSFRGCRAGIHKQRLITTLTGFGRNHHSYNQYKAYLSPIPNTCRIARNPNLIYISCYNNDTNDFNELSTDALKNRIERQISTEPRPEFVPGFILSNTMSLAPKIDEIHHCVLEANVDFACLTETWLSDSVGDNAIQIPGYNIACKDRVIGQHGGVCLYINVKIPYEVLNQYHHPLLEVLWVKTRPHRLPRGLSCIIIGSIYHPPSAHAETMINYLLEQLASIESTYLNCDFMILGDFNNLDISRIKNQFRLKQLIQFHTRGNRTLDLILTNLEQYYHPPVRLSPFGLSDHFTVLIEPKLRTDHQTNKRIRQSRDLRPSRRAAMGAFINDFDWSILNQFQTCEEKLNYFQAVISTGMDILLPVKKSRICNNEPPWMNHHLKSLIHKRQLALATGNKHRFNHLRNAVNRERKKCRSKFYESKVKQLKSSHPKQWWK